MEDRVERGELTNLLARRAALGPSEAAARSVEQDWTQLRSGATQNANQQVI